MTATSRFIEDAVKGGYDKANRFLFKSIGQFINSDVPETILLDPLAWQAVAKVRGWESYEDTLVKDEDWVNWRQKMHVFVDHLADGKTIDEALQAIE